MTLRLLLLACLLFEALALGLLLLSLLFLEPLAFGLGLLSLFLLALFLELDLFLPLGLLGALLLQRFRLALGFLALGLGLRLTLLLGLALDLELGESLGLGLALLLELAGFLADSFELFLAGAGLFLLAPFLGIDALHLRLELGFRDDRGLHRGRAARLQEMRTEIQTHADGEQEQEVNANGQDDRTRRRTPLDRVAGHGPNQFSAGSRVTRPTLGTPASRSSMIAPITDW